ncbi:MAG: alpha/beta hydrolase [Calditrichia bacterium]
MKVFRIFALIILAGVVLTACPYDDLSPIEFEDLAYPYPVKKAQINDSVTVAYVDEGSGSETIIFVHGLGSYLPAWQKNIAELRNNYRCIAVDLPGYGKSSKGPYPIGMAFYADVLAQFLVKLDLPSATFAGHSMGGQIVMTLAIQKPEAVNKLILVDPAGIETFTPGEKDWFKQVVTKAGVALTTPQQIRANIVANFNNMPKDAEFMVVDRIRLRGATDFDKYCLAIEQSVAGMVDEPVFDYLGEISQPTLVIFGENDNLIPNPYLHGGKSASIGKIAEEKIPNSKLVMIENCGHFAQFEQPEAVNQAIVSFIK